FATGDFANTVHQRRAGDVAIDHAVGARRHVALRALAGVGEDDDACPVLVGSREDGVEVGVKASGNDQHRGAKLVERHEHLLGSLRLRHYAHLVFYGQHLGDASAENRLIVGQNKFQHGSRSRLTVANEFVRIDYASDAPVVPGLGAGVGLIGPHDAAAALNHNIFLAAGDFRRQGDLKLYGRADLECSVGADVHTGGTQIAGHAATGVTHSIFPVNLDRQLQRKPFPGTRFGHDSSSAVALRCNLNAENQARKPSQKSRNSSPKADEQLFGVYHGK